MSTQQAVAARWGRNLPLLPLLTALAVIAGGLTALAVATPLLDTVVDLCNRPWRDLSHFGQQLGRGFGRVSWAWMPLLVLVATVHYGFAALALRAASGLRLRLPEAVLAQLAAAAANRITPCGLGGAAVNARYLTRRGMAPSGAIGSVSALQLLGPLTDVVVVTGVVLAVPGAISESLHLVAGVGVSAARVADWFRRYAEPTLLVVVEVLALLWLRHRDRPLLPRHRPSLRATIAGTCGHMRLLLRRPRDLAVACVSSGTTTIVLAIGFVISTLSVGGVRSLPVAVMIFTTYLVASAVASAVPLPAAAGSTEAALLAVLLADGVPAVQAVPAVLIFRAVTFWAPAPVGLIAAGVLRRRRIL
jgi:uncharacterized membrane protein YbhN (UPF0104 family)